MGQIDLFVTHYVVYDPRENTQPMLWTPDIPAGGPVDSELWPVIWRRAA